MGTCGHDRRLAHAGGLPPTENSGFFTLNLVCTEGSSLLWLRDASGNVGLDPFLKCFLNPGNLMWPLDFGTL